MTVAQLTLDLPHRTALDAEDYYDFQVTRPTVELDGDTRRINWPTTRVSWARVPGSGRGWIPQGMVERVRPGNS